LETHINDETPISIGLIETVKEHVPAYPFIDNDAQPIIKAMLSDMTTEGRVKSNERMLKLLNEIELSRALQRCAKRAGINLGNKRLRFHCLRKFLCDRLSSHMSDSKWKQILGKKITEGAYVSAESLRQDYKRAVADTTFGQKIVDLDARVREIEKLKQDLGPIERGSPDFGAIRA
jgi:integrase